MKTFPGWVHLASLSLAFLLLALCGVALDFPFTFRTLTALGLILVLIASPGLLALVWRVTSEQGAAPPSSGCLMMLFGWALLLGLILTHVLIRLG